MATLHIGPPMVIMTSTLQLSASELVVMTRLAAAPTEAIIRLLDGPTYSHRLAWDRITEALDAARDRLLHLEAKRQLVDPQKTPATPASTPEESRP